MATITNVTLKLEPIAGTTTSVKATVSYILNTDNNERVAGSSFRGNVQLLGVDPLAKPVIADVGVTAFTINPTNPTNSKERVFNVTKAALNEDPGFGPMGEEQTDEIQAKVTLQYNAGMPIGYTNPAPAFSATITGRAWR